MYRNPLRVPSDVRKVKAVSRTELYKYHGVIVVNVKDHRSLLSILGGGDYDGGE
jgi:RNA-dependent RNA polymerase